MIHVFWEQIWMFSCYFLYLFMCVPCSQSSKIYFISFSLVSLVKVKLEINLAENINEALYNHWSLLRENCAAIWYQINKRKNSTISTLKYWNNVENTKETIFCDHFSHLNQIVFHLHKNFWFLLNILVKTFAPSVRSSFLLSNDTVKYLLENISPCICPPWLTLAELWKIAKMTSLHWYWIIITMKRLLMYLISLLIFAIEACAKYLLLIFSFFPQTRRIIYHGRMISGWADDGWCLQIIFRIIFVDNWLILCWLWLPERMETLTKDGGGGEKNKNKKSMI